MAPAPHVNPMEVITLPEAESIRHLQNAYSARAKAAAGELAGVLELDEETTKLLIGNLGLKLADVNFEERKLVAERLDEIAVILGGTAAGKTINVPAAVLEITREEPSAEEATVSEAQEETADSQDGQDSGQEDITDTKGDTRDAKNDDETSDEEKSRIPEGYYKWLNRLFDAKQMEKIALMSEEQVKALTESIIEKYIGLRIPRLTKDGRQNRIRQLAQLAEGKTVREISESENTNVEALRLGLVKMAEGIKKRVNTSELIPVLDSPEPIAQEKLEAAEVESTEAETTGHGEMDTSENEGIAGEEEQEPVPLTPDQSRWLKRAFGGEELVPVVEEMTANQREN